MVTGCYGNLGLNETSSMLIFITSKSNLLFLFKVLNLNLIIKKSKFCINVKQHNFTLATLNFVVARPLSPGATFVIVLRMLFTVYPCVCFQILQHLGQIDASEKSEMKTYIQMVLQKDGLSTEVEVNGTNAENRTPRV